MSSSIRIFSGTISGFDALPIEVEVDSAPGLHFFNIVGLPDKTVEESKDRIASAIKNSGFIPPNQKNRRIIVNLAPANIRKEGPGFDLPIALGYLLTTSQIKDCPDRTLFLGELSLDGSLRRINGILPIAIMARQHGFKEIVIPFENTGEASLVSGISIVGAKNITEIVNHITGKQTLRSISDKAYSPGFKDLAPIVDMAHIKGQENAKRALTIAAAGRHNVLMFGPPGTGKTMLAQAFSGILPNMSYEEALEVTKIYSISGLLNGQSLITTRPFRNPHHTTSSAAIIGGGTSPKPGEISLSHRGVLFLDELPEFPRNVLEALRQPMENGTVVVSRSAGTVKFPSKFILLSAMNPCPCGNYGDEQKACVCSAQAVYKYQRKVSGPILDRIDIQINIPRESYENIRSDNLGMGSNEIKKIIHKVMAIQTKRFAETAKNNSEMTSKETEAHCKLTPEAENIFKQAVISQNLSGRSYYKILKLARTIADLEESAMIQFQHIAEAISYRIQNDSGSFST